MYENGSLGSKKYDLDTKNIIKGLKNKKYDLRMWLGYKKYDYGMKYVTKILRYE